MVKLTGTEVHCWKCVVVPHGRKVNHLLNQQNCEELKIRLFHGNNPNKRPFSKRKIIAITAKIILSTTCTTGDRCSACVSHNAPTKLRSQTESIRFIALYVVVTLYSFYNNLISKKISSYYYLINWAVHLWIL